MAGSFVDVGNSKNPQLLITKINTMLNNAPPSVPTTYDKVALVDSSGMAEILVYPMRVSVALEEQKGPTEQRNFSTAEVISISCQARRVEPPGTLIPVGPIYDTYGLLRMRAPDEVKQALKIWDRALAKLINAGGVFDSNYPTYDGQAFFGTHSSNPGKLGAATYSNDIVASTDEAGFLAAWQNMQLIPGYDGTLINVDMGKPLILVPTAAMKVAFDKLINEGLIAKQLAGAAASENTRLDGWAETVLMPELVNPLDPLSTKRWYLINRNDNSRRAFIVRNPVKPQFRITTENDVYAHTNDALALYYKTYGGVNYGLPHLVTRCTLP
jgi:hypothetical protein